MLKDLLCLVPVIDRLLQRLILVARQGDGDRLGFDLAGPLITGAASARSPILNVAVADPTQASQTCPELGVFLLDLREMIHEYEA